MTYQPKAPTKHSVQSSLAYAILALESERAKVKPRSMEHKELCEVIKILTEIRDKEIARLLAEKEE